MRFARIATPEPMANTMRSCSRYSRMNVLTFSFEAAGYATAVLEGTRLHDDAPTELRSVDGVTRCSRSSARRVWQHAANQNACRTTREPGRLALPRRPRKRR